MENTFSVGQEVAVIMYGGAHKTEIIRETPKFYITAPATTMKNWKGRSGELKFYKSKGWETGHGYGNHGRIEAITSSVEEEILKTEKLVEAQRVQAEAQRAANRKAQEERDEYLRSPEGIHETEAKVHYAHTTIVVDEVRRTLDHRESEVSLLFGNETLTCVTVRQYDEYDYANCRYTGLSRSKIEVRYENKSAKAIERYMDVIAEALKIAKEWDLEIGQHLS